MNSIKILFFFCCNCFIFGQVLAQENANQYATLSYPEIDSLMYIYYDNQNYEEAILLMQAGRDKAKIEFGAEDSVFSIYLSNLGFFHQQLGNLDQALSLYLQTKKIQEKNQSEPDLEYAITINNLADIYADMGLIDEALTLFLQAVNIEKETLGDQHPHYAASLSNLASFYEKIGDFDKASSLFLSVIAIRKKAYGNQDPNYAGSLSDLAGLYNEIGDFDKALPLYSEALAIIKKVYGEQDMEYARILHNLAYAYKKEGLYDKALPLFIQSLNIVEKVLGKQHPNVAQALHNLARLHQQMGNFDPAMPLYLQAIAIRKSVLGNQAPSVISSLYHLASLHKDMGHFDQAWEVLTEAMNLAAALNSPLVFDEAWFQELKSTTFLSNVHIFHMIEALKIADFLIQKDPNIIDVSSKRIIVARSATELLNKQRNQTSNEKDKLRVLDKSSDWLLRSFAIFDPVQHSAKAFNLAEQNKSILLLQASNSESAYQLGELPEALIKKDKDLNKKQSNIQAKLIKRQTPSVKDSLLHQLNTIQQQKDELILLIKNKHPKYFQLKHQQIETKVEDIQAHLNEQTALLEYVISDSLLHIFFVDQNEIQWIQVPVEKKELRLNIKSLHHALSDYKTIATNKNKAYDNYTKYAHWFYQKLVAPALKDKKNIRHLILVTDGEIGHLPFEAFLVESATQTKTNYSDLHYLVDDYAISYNYSATLWKENMESPNPVNNGLMFGVAADYTSQLAASNESWRQASDLKLRKSLKPLLAARKEVEILQEKYQGFYAFDSLASEKIVKEKAGDFAILHLATHGILNTKNPVLSSLAFTEDNDSIESNFWQAYEISKMELHADLVVLSACETGYGKFEKGNGIASLARAFMYAGASSLIVSLWQVNDFATSEIMRRLYDNLANGMEKDEALRQAKIQYIESATGIAAHPAFWSAFIQIGNTNSIHIKKKGDTNYWSIAAGIIALLFIGFVAIRRRKKEA